MKTKTLKQLKVLKDNEFSDNKLYYYLKPTDSLAARFYGQPKIHKSEVPICPTVSYSGSPLYNLNRYIANILKRNAQFVQKVTFGPLMNFKQNHYGRWKYYKNFYF